MTIESGLTVDNVIAFNIDCTSAILVTILIFIVVSIIEFAVAVDIWTVVNVMVMMVVIAIFFANCFS